MSTTNSSTQLTFGPIHLDRVTMDAAIRQLWAEPAQMRSSPRQVMASNTQFLHLARRDPRFAAIANQADLNVADGMSFFFASYLLGKPLPQRITGIDLMLKICEECARTNRSVFLLGGHPGAAQSAAKVLASRYPGLVIAGVCRPPLGSEFEPPVVEQIRAQIRRAMPDVLFVCFGAPRQEFWIQQHASDLPVKIVMGNGAALDVVAGLFNRPPSWIQDIGCEWLYRIMKEPRRLWKRYLMANTVFLRVFVELLLARP